MNLDVLTRGGSRDVGITRTDAATWSGDAAATAPIARRRHRHYILSSSSSSSSSSADVCLWLTVTTFLHSTSNEAHSSGCS